jgi:hypothetical protein
LTGSNARVVFTRRARTVGDSVRTTFGREKNTEAHGKRLQRLHTLLYGFVLSGRSGWGRRFLDELEVVFLARAKSATTFTRVRVGLLKVLTYWVYSLCSAYNSSLRYMRVSSMKRGILNARVRSLCICRFPFDHKRYLGVWID